MKDATEVYLMSKVVCSIHEFPDSKRFYGKLRHWGPKPLGFMKYNPACGNRCRGIIHV